MTYPKILNGTLAFSWYFCPFPTSPTKFSAFVKFWLRAEIPLFCYLYFLKYLFLCVGINVWDDGVPKSFSVPSLSRPFHPRQYLSLTLEFVTSRLSGSQQYPVIFLPPPPQSLDTDPGKDTRLVPWVLGSRLQSSVP